MTKEEKSLHRGGGNGGGTGTCSIGGRITTSAGVTTTTPSPGRTARRKRPLEGNDDDDDPSSAPSTPTRPAVASPSSPTTTPARRSSPRRRAAAGGTDASSASEVAGEGAVGVGPSSSPSRRSSPRRGAYAPDADDVDATPRRRGGGGGDDGASSKTEKRSSSGTEREMRAKRRRRERGDDDEEEEEAAAGDGTRRRDPPPLRRSLMGPKSTTARRSDDGNEEDDRRKRIRGDDGGHSDENTQDDSEGDDYSDEDDDEEEDEKTDVFDTVLAEASDLLGAAAEAQAMGRLKMASSYLTLLHARLMGVGRRFDRSNLLERASAPPAARVVRGMAAPASTAAPNAPDRGVDDEDGGGNGAKLPPGVGDEGDVAGDYGGDRGDEDDASSFATACQSLSPPPPHPHGVGSEAPSSSPRPEVAEDDSGGEGGPTRFGPSDADADALPSAPSVVASDARLTSAQAKANGEYDGADGAGDGLSPDDSRTMTTPPPENGDDEKVEGSGAGDNGVAVRVADKENASATTEPTPPEVAATVASTEAAGDSDVAARKSTDDQSTSEDAAPASAPSDDGSNGGDRDDAALSRMLARFMPRGIDLDEGMMEHLARAAEELHRKRQIERGVGGGAACKGGASGTATPPASRMVAWSNEEHERCIAAADRFGRDDAAAIAGAVGTRTEAQVRAHLRNASEKERATLSLDKELSTTSGVDVECNEQ